MTSSHPDWLCRSLNVKDEHPVVWKAPLTPEYTVCLRPVSLHTDADIKAIHGWLSNGYPAPLPLDQLRVFFILLGESSFAQAFMILLNDSIPVGQFEVYQALQDELKDVFEVTEGDYRIYIPVIPVIALHNEFTVHIIETCVQYLFSCAGVRRLFWVVPGHDKERNKIAVKTGFQLLESFPDTTIEGSQMVNLYWWTAGEW